jgi:hypothetical protein
MFWQYFAAIKFSEMHLIRQLPVLSEFKVLVISQGVFRGQILGELSSHFWKQTTFRKKNDNG